MRSLWREGSLRSARVPDEGAGDVMNEWTYVMERRFAKLHRQTPELSFTTIASMMSAEFCIELTPNACIGKPPRVGLAMRGKRGDSRRIPDQKKARPLTIRIDAPSLP